ncbi:MAG: hypothetical protein KKB12_00155, partial [Candidatus Omnitrophica bacterium]|nr:hypothetical protein [Candidatus Omnitrophota bacterium]
MPGINVLDHAGLYVEQLKDLAESIKIKLEDDSQYLLFSPEEIARTKEKPTQNITEDDYKVNLKNLKEEQRVVSGVHDIYGSLFDELGYKNVIKNPERNDASVDML